MDILVDKNLTTRKEHQCFGCYRKFPKGTVMHYQKNVHEGEIYNLHTCLTCRELLDFHFYDDTYEQGYAWEDKNSDERTVGMTMEEFLAFMKANFQPLDYFWRNRGVLLPLEPTERSLILKRYNIPESRYPHPHVHTPLTNGGHVTSDVPLTQEAMQTLGDVVEHFYHKEI